MNAATTFQQLSNDISEGYKILDKYRSSYREEHLQLSKLRIQKVNLEFIVKQFQDNKDHTKLKDTVKQVVGYTLTNYRQVAFQSVIDSCRNDPTEFNILYHNLPLTTRTKETRLLLSDQSKHHRNYGLSTDEQLCCQHNDNDYDVYGKFLLGEAERFFNERIKDLAQVCISHLAEVYNSASRSLEYARGS